MHSFLFDVKESIRGLPRRSGLTSAVVVLLALAIGAVTTVLTLVDRALLAPLPFPDGDRLVMVWETWAARGLDRSWVSPPNYEDWKKAASSFAGLASCKRVTSFNLSGTGEPERVEGAFVSPEFFSVLGSRPAVGRTFLTSSATAGDDQVVLGNGLWRRRFAADPAVVGRRIVLSGKPYTVLGVMPSSFEVPAGAELWLPLRLREGEWPRTAHFLQVVGRLRPGVTPAAAQADLDHLARRLAAEFHDSVGWGIHVVPLREELVGEVRPALRLLVGVAGLVLLIACANASSFLLALTVRRSPELAVRSALGASRLRIGRQLFLENLLLALTAGFAGLAVALNLAPAFLQLSAHHLLYFTPRLDLRALATTFLVSLLAALLFGAAPVLRAACVQPRDALQGGVGSASHTPGRRIWRNALVAVDVGLSLVLLLGAGLLVRSFLVLRAQDPGCRLSGVETLRLTLPAADYPEEKQVAAVMQSLLDELRSLQGIDGVGATTALPLTDTAGGTAFLPRDMDGQNLSDQPLAQYTTVAPGYFSSLGIPLRRGRDFDHRDRALSPPVVIVSAGLARRYWPGVDPVGRQMFISLGNTVWYEIVGEVGDVKESRFDAEPRPMLYLPYAQKPARNVWVTLHTRLPWRALAPSVRGRLRALDPGLAVEVRSMNDWAAESLARERFLIAVLSALAALALLVSAVGIYGASSYSVAERSQEAGIRMALGASPWRLGWQLVGAAMLVVAQGLALGLLLFYLLARTLAGFLYQVPARDAATSVAMTVGVAALALLAVSLPVRRLLRLDPRVFLQSV